MKKLLSIAFAAFLLLPASAILAGEGEGHDCSHEAHAAGEKMAHSCSADCNHEEGAHASTETVELTGKLLCRHCNLHETQVCEKVFVTENNERYSLCPHSDIESLQALSDHGAATLVVTGHLMSGDDHGDPVLMAESAVVAE